MVQRRGWRRFVGGSSYWRDAFMKVYMVDHVHEHASGNEDIKLIGIYSTRQLAREAVKRMKIKRGFRDQPKNFYISQITVDEDHWTEGFVDGTP